MEGIEICADFTDITQRRTMQQRSQKHVVKNPALTEISGVAVCLHMCLCCVCPMSLVSGPLKLQLHMVVMAHVSTGIKPRSS
ncbi:mCG148377 [Mus musculus]|nr:mCG148377 [Mus musculus]